MQIKKTSILKTSLFKVFRRIQSNNPFYYKFKWHTQVISSMALLLVFSSAFAQPLNGTYTIGGVNPDFITFNQAVEDLEDFGVSGPVIFNVRPGEYIEQIRIHELLGSSDYNTVTFQSESGNQDEVVLRHTHLYTFTNSNYTIFLDGTDNIVFKNMTIQADPTTIYSYDKNRVIYITNNANNVLFENNKLISWYTTPTGFSEYTHCIFIGYDTGSGLANDSIQFTNNLIVGGTHGIGFKGSLNNDENKPIKTIIRNNSFANQTSASIELSHCKNSQISNNQIISSSLETTGIFKGIRINGHSDSLTINANLVQISTKGMGVEVIASNIAFSGHNQLTNNMIYINNVFEDDNTIGIHSNFNDSLLIAFNSIKIDSESELGICIKTQSNDVSAILNNHLINSGGGLCYSFNDMNMFGFNSNYNNLYNNGNTIARINDVNYNSISDLFSTFGLDEHSSSLSPQFISNSLLISSSTELYNTGTPIISVTHDYYDTPRSLISPDIGFFEGEVAFNDVGIIASLSEEIVLCPGDSFPIYAKAKNFGTQTITDIEFMYSVDEQIFQATEWSGSLAPGDETDNLLIGTITVANINSQSFKIWTSSPNGQFDTYSLNDTLQFNKNAAMTGDYSIGSSGDFQTISAAIQTVTNLGVCGAVVFNVEPGVYDEQLYINSIPGSSEANTITFQSSTLDSSDVEIKYNQQTSLTNFVLRVENSGQFLRFRHLTFYSYHLSHRNIIEFTRGASNIIFSNNYVHNNVQIGTLISATGSYIVTPQGNQFLAVNNVRIENNRFSGGYYQLKIASVSNFLGSGNQVIENVFEGTTRQSLEISEQQYFTVLRNTFRGTRIQTNDHSCIQIENCPNGGLIEKNDIYVLAGNIRINILEDCSGSIDNPIIVRNNFISIKWNSTPYSQSLSGFTIHGSSNVLIVNNSFNLISNYNSMLSFQGALSNITVLNNALKSHGDTRLYTFWPMDGFDWLSGDFNGVSPGFNTAFTSDDFEQSMEELQALGLENNSVIASIHYQNDDDLHMINSIGLSGSGIPLSEVIEDIDGETRDTQFPDIGADEWEMDSLTYHDIKILRILSPDSGLCEVNDSLQLEIVNKSAIPIYSYSIKWWLFGNFQDSIFITETIAPYDTAIVYVGNLNFIPNTGYELSFEINHPNETHDNFFNDNTKSTYFYHLDYVTIYSHTDALCTDDIQLLIKAFPHESILWSNGSTANNIIINEPGIYTVTVTSNAGCIVSDTITIE